MAAAEGPEARLFSQLKARASPTCWQLLQHLEYHGEKLADEVRTLEMSQR